MLYSYTASCVWSARSLYDIWIWLHI